MKLGSCCNASVRKGLVVLLMPGMIANQSKNPFGDDFSCGFDMTGGVADFLASTSGQTVCLDCRLPRQTAAAIDPNTGRDVRAM
jgi:hypothetical protein